MPNIIQMQEARKGRMISIKDVVIRARKAGKEIDYDLLIMTIRSEFYLSDRIAKSDVNLALFELGLSKETLNTGEIICQQKKLNSTNGKEKSLTPKETSVLGLDAKSENPQ